MSQPTYRILRYIDGVAPPSLEMPITALAGHPYLEHVATLALYNDFDSNVKLKIKRVVIRPISGRTSTTAPIVNIDIISAVSGGDDIVPFKMDTNNLDLPSQILIKEDPPSVTSVSTIKRTMGLMTMSFTRALAGLSDASLGQYSSGNDSAVTFDSGYCDLGQTQGITLHEGDGFAVTYTTLQCQQTVMLNMLFKTEDGTYGVRNAITPEPARPTFAIFNGVGSGKTITILLMEMHEIGDDTLPFWMIEKIDSIGEQVAPPSVSESIIKFDTNNADLPTDVIVRSNCKVKLMGSKSGAFMATPTYRRNLLNIFGVGSTTGVNWAERAYREPIEQNPDFMMVLNEGEGMAIIKNTASSVSRAEMAIEFNVETIPAGLTEQAVASDFPKQYVKKGKAQELKSKVY